MNPDALRSLPQVHVHAVVTYYDTVAPNLFVQDGTAGIWVDLRASKVPPPEPGQLLDLYGTAAGGFSSYIDHPRWTVLGSSGFPKPIPLSYEQAMMGIYDSQWAEMEGVVRSFVLQAEGSVLVIDVATPTGSFKVRVPDWHQPIPIKLVDSKMRFRGVMGSAFNRLNQLVGIHIMTPSLDLAQVLVPAPPNPFALPTTPMNGIRRFSTDLPDLHRVKVAGIVTARFPGQGLFLMDNSGGLYVESDDGSPVQPGQEVEVAGFPAVGAYSPVLQSAAIQPTGQHRLLKPVDITGKMALHGNYDAQLVRIRGVVHAHYALGPDEVLALESSDGVVYQATIRKRFVPGGLTTEIGSKVELTGICTIKADTNGNPAAFEIVLRTPADVRLISSPPWLTGARMVMIAVALVLITFAVAAWVVILRRQVRQQTDTIQRDLKARLALEERYRWIFERNLTGLFIATPNGAIVACNDACARILGFANHQHMINSPEAAGKMIRELSAGAFAENSLVNSEHHFQRPDGAWAWALSNIRVVPGENHPLVEGALIDISERKLADERIQFLAYYDGLTGLPNRTLLVDRLQQAMASAKRRNEQVAVLFLDVDWFKNINDSLGHSAGDRLLQMIADHLRTCAREQDTVARLGGDEFVLVLDGVSEAADAVVVAERLLRQIDTGFEIEGRLLNVTCSIGIALYPQHGTNVDTLIKNADAAMYCSKDGGRNRYSFFKPEMAELALEQLSLETNLRAAIERGELSLVFQPEISLETGQVTCCEALLRWTNSELGIVPPDRFIPVAERTGMITSIGRWVLRNACMQAKAWQDVLPSARVAVNVSEVQLREEGFCAMVREILNEVGLPPQRLELELTESLLVSRNGEPRRVLQELHDMGISLALDDFGTGYSSFGYLSRFPIDKLKIDRSFIRDLSLKDENATIVGALVSMARTLKLHVTAEGVETQEEASILQQLGCEQAQGYYFCRPATAENLDGVLRGGLPVSLADRAPAAL